ncbi:SGNH hydrolase domain-containing protein, partial [Bacillus anthracis]|uniref:SGNH hydrolase domain-containing protein n=1 Tax=Bacillus anthracis TaxID=1392 RepID=UPI0039A4A576
KNAGIKLVFVNGIPTADKNIVQQLARRLQTWNSVDLRVDRKALEASNTRATIAFGRHPEVATLNPMELLCDEAKCEVERNGKAITVDGGHLSQSGAFILSPLFNSTLADIKANQQSLVTME